MYILEVKKSPDFDEAEEIFESDIRDIANSIPELLSDVEETSVELAGNIIRFDSHLTEREIKEGLKEVFSHHFGNVRFVSLEKR